MRKYLYLIFVILVFISIGCRSETETVNTAVNTTTKTANNSAVVETEPEVDVNSPFVPSADPKDDLLNSTKRLQAKEFWSAVNENNVMPEIKTELEYIKPDRYHVKNSLTELIIIGGEAYSKEEGKWELLPEDVGGQIEAMKKSFNSEGLKAIREVTKSKPEKLDGKEATVYTYTVESNEIAPNTSTKVWIANDNGLPLKIVIESENAGKKQVVTTRYNYEKPVRIEAPEVAGAPEN